ncbi:DUF72 domain-containing protein [Aquabacter sp. CN5-332]|uniref:DUF72 domain-containing protein n=1 Tax=Aquabacter sp. CN5-332 TaxID=3156608 RepID=UPI0032B35CFB
MPANIRIGISGWTYKPWRGAFYPKGLGIKRELSFAAEVFRSIEVNGTFYGLQRPSTFERWAEETPDDFLFSVKGPRFLTHIKRLREPLPPLANFFASGVLKLGGKLGPLLWQFPPSFQFDEKLFEDFLKLLPADSDAAAHLSRKHDERMNGRAFLGTGRDHALRHAVEIRHESFLVPAFVDLLRHHKVAFVIADTVSYPCRMDLTADDFVYCRLHGSEELYRSRYAPEALERWAKRVKAWTSGRAMKDGRFIAPTRADRKKRDVFLYFDNTDKLHAPEDAQFLMRLLGQEPGGQEISVDTMRTATEGHARA